MLRQSRNLGIHVEINELLDWLSPPVTQEQKIQFRPIYEQMLKDSGMSEQNIALFLVHAMPTRRGAKMKYRQQWLEAWDKKLVSPETTYLDLAETYCACEKSSHDKHCAETIRQGVFALRKLAYKHRVLDFAESLAPHPRLKDKRK